MDDGAQEKAASDSSTRGAVGAAPCGGVRRTVRALPGARTEFDGDAPPRVEVRRGARQVQDETTDGADDVGSELEQPVAEPRHLGAGTRGARRAQPEFLQEHVSGGGQQDAQLVRPEPTAARAVELEAIDQFLDAVLDVAAGTVDPLVDESAASAGGSSRRSAGCPAVHGQRDGRPRP